MPAELEDQQEHPAAGGAGQTERAARGHPAGTQERQMHPGGNSISSAVRNEAAGTDPEELGATEDRVGDKDRQVPESG